MFKTEKQKIYALKLAPWWKRLLAYLIDSLFLLVVLVIFISGIYGEELSLLLDSITNYGGLKLGTEEQIFSPGVLNRLSTLSSREQNVAYWMYIIQNKYSNSIFLLNQIISIIYFGVFWWSTGQTIGAKILKIKVTTLLNEAPSILSIFSRVVALKLIEFAWGIPALVVTNHTLKQRFQDTLSQTVVVEEYSKDIEAEILNDLTDDNKSTTLSDKDSSDNDDL